jgi:hypothetical protein
VGGGGNTPDKVAATGAHLSGRSTVRCDGGRSMATSEAVEALRQLPVLVRRTYSTSEPQGR